MQQIIFFKSLFVGYSRLVALQTWPISNFGSKTNPCFMFEFDSVTLIYQTWHQQLVFCMGKWHNLWFIHAPKIRTLLKICWCKWRVFYQGWIQMPKSLRRISNLDGPDNWVRWVWHFSRFGILNFDSFLRIELLGRLFFSYSLSEYMIKQFFSSSKWKWLMVFVFKFPQVFLDGIDVGWRSSIQIHRDPRRGGSKRRRVITIYRLIHQGLSKHCDIVEFATKLMQFNTSYRGIKIQLFVCPIGIGLVLLGRYICTAKLLNMF